MGLGFLFNNLERTIHTVLFNPSYSHQHLSDPFCLEIKQHLHNIDHLNTRNSCPQTPAVSLHPYPLWRAKELYGCSKKHHHSVASSDGIYRSISHPSAFRAHLEGQVFDVLLHGRVIPRAADEPLGIEHSVLRVGCKLVLGGVPDQALPLGRECHIGRRDTVPLVVGDDFHAAILEDADAAGGGEGEQRSQATLGPAPSWAPSFRPH